MFLSVSLFPFIFENRKWCRPNDEYNFTIFILFVGSSLSRTLWYSHLHCCHFRKSGTAEVSFDLLLWNEPISEIVVESQRHIWLRLRRELLFYTISRKCQLFINNQYYDFINLWNLLFSSQTSFSFLTTLVHLLEYCRWPEAPITIVTDCSPVWEEIIRDVYQQAFEVPFHTIHWWVNSVLLCEVKEEYCNCFRLIIR